MTDEIEDDQRGELPAERELPYPGSLCHGCAERRYVTTKRSVFVLCTALPNKYPPQPVLRCPGHRPSR